jgi:uncharacterized protein (TIGR00251 family)
MEQPKISVQGERVIVEVHVLPRATRSAIIGLHDGRLKLALRAPPVDGAANEELIAFFAAALGVARRAVTLVRGEKSRQKTLAITGVREEQVRALLPRGE